MIWSVMPLGYQHELDLLEIKIREQESVVDQFIVCEAAWTYSGDPKPQHVDLTDARWSPWRGRLQTLYVETTDVPNIEPHQGFGVREHWQRENYQRSMIGKAMRDLAPGDVVVISDLDEILKASTIAAYGDGHDRIVHPEIPMHRHFLNLHWRDRMALSIARICRGHHVLADPLGVEGVRRAPAQEWSVPYWNAYHDPRYDLAYYGWHFSWMGGTRAIDDKLRLAAHPEERTARNSTRTAIRELVKHGADLQGEHRALYWLPDARLPAAALDEKFAHLRCGPERATPGGDATLAANPDMYWRG